MYGLLGLDNDWSRFNYINIWNLRVQKNLDVEKKTPFKLLITGAVAAQRKQVCFKPSLLAYGCYEVVERRWTRKQYSKLYIDTKPEWVILKRAGSSEQSVKDVKERKRKIQKP